MRSFKVKTDQRPINSLIDSLFPFKEVAFFPQGRGPCVMLVHEEHTRRLQQKEVEGASLEADVSVQQLLAS